MTTTTEARRRRVPAATAEGSVMGTRALVVVTGGTPGLAEQAIERLRDLEARWSRFRADSELSRANAGAGAPVLVSPETLLLFERAVAAWQHTGGSFDPTVHDAVVAAGYDRDLAAVRARGGGGRPGASGPPPGCEGIVLAPELPAVTLPAGVHLDGGGIAKGLAADLVVGELRAAGASGALVDVGGDVVVAGEPPSGVAWRIALEVPADPVVRLAAGAVVTSSVVHRRWVDDAGCTAHHVIDPRTGRPANGDAVSATVIAGAGWWAEALATAALLAGPVHGPRLVAHHGAIALVVDRAGQRHLSPGSERFIEEVGAQ